MVPVAARQRRRRCCSAAAAPQPGADAWSAIAQSPEVGLVVAGGAAVATAAVSVTRFARRRAAERAAAALDAQAISRGDAVLIFGAKGRTGRLIVKQLLESGRTVVAAVRSAAIAAEVFATLGLTPGPAAAGPGTGHLVLRGGVDVTNDASVIDGDLFRGVTQVVIALGAVAGRLANGRVAFAQGAAPKDVEGRGVINILLGVAGSMAPLGRTQAEVISLAAPEEWQHTFRMAPRAGGVSSNGSSGRQAAWGGTLEPDNGTATARSCALSIDLSRFDGLSLRVAAAGCRTLQLECRTGGDAPVTYAAMVDLPDTGDWATVDIPWYDFVALRDAASGIVDTSAAPFTGAGIETMEVVLSTTGLNRMPTGNMLGPFELSFDGGISAYRDPRPAVVVLSSAGVERQMLAADDYEAGSSAAAGVRGNPGYLLHWKYESECAVRALGLPYTIVRATAMDDGDAAASEPCLLEADQGDQLSGAVARHEAAAVAAAALTAPAAVGKTFELRRSEAADARGREMGPHAYTRLFLKLSTDETRWRVGLPPLPALVPAGDKAPARELAPARR